MLIGILRELKYANAGNLQSSLPYRNIGLSGRFTYAYDDRYFSEFNFGYNGSERFAKSERFGFFPSFGFGWSFNKDRTKLDRIWRNIIDIDTDIVINHGPPKGILDISFDRFSAMERCGDKSLMNRIIEVRPKLVLFGHIHNCEDIINQGILQISTLPTKFSNGSVVKDGRFGKLSSNGNVFEIKTKKSLFEKVKYELGRVLHKYSRTSKTQI